MKEYTVKDLFTVMKRDVPTKHIIKNFYLVHNHMLDWDFSEDSPATVTCILLKGWHVAKLV